MDLDFQAFEKNWKHSKKCIAFTLTQLSLLAIVILSLLIHKGAFNYPLTIFLTACVSVMGFLAVGLIGKIAWLDKFVRLGTLNAFSGKKIDIDPNE